MSEQRRDRSNARMPWEKQKQTGSENLRLERRTDDGKTVSIIEGNHRIIGFLPVYTHS